MLEKTYAPAPVEDKWRQAWKDARLFSSQPGARLPGKEPFVVVIPQPNVTGALHMGHALNNTLQDVLVRWHKLHGREALWVPGTDHGGIATQNVMEKQLKAEGLSRHELGRVDFIARMQAWVAQIKTTILGQLDRLGCALDWEREAFTMDEGRARSVHHAFETLWKKGLIYRGERMVNWCVRCGTALSDIEVEHEDRKGHLWHIHYPKVDGSEGVVVATTRPETMLGDTAVAVNPRDERYRGLSGKRVKLPLVGREIAVVGDDSVDFAFGTGAVKVTPGHDVNDFEIGVRHSLETIKVIGPDGRITDKAPEAFQGLSREKAREEVLKGLEAGGYLRKTEDHHHSVGTCYRCSSVIEPLLSDQWFVRMSAMAAPAIAAVESGKFKIHPESWAKPYMEWLRNIRDWCISRQIWWGHRIPVWYCQECYDRFMPRRPSAKPVVSVGRPERCGECGGNSFEQDEDVLDTWFSSGLWPMSVFGWPDKTPDLAYYYPTSVLVTGYEILYLWVARMQMMGLEAMGEVPFSDAVIHGIVRDKKGKKMSKSLGNVVDPLVLMDKFGTDALRFSLMAQAHPGRDIPFSEDSTVGARNFSNKLWNSTRFVLMNLPEAAPAGGYSLEALDPASLELADQWILAEYRAALAETRARMEAWNPAAAADVLYGFLWDKFCDWYVELAKVRLQGPDGPAKETARAILVGVLSGTLKMLHPFMPYITEELFAALRPYSGETADFILRAGAPGLGAGFSDEDSRKKMAFLMEATAAIRSVRSQLNVPPGQKIKVYYSNGPEAACGLLARHAGYVNAMARLETLEASPDGSRPPQSATAVAGGLTFYIPLAGVIDFEAERKRLEKELAKTEEDLVKVARKAENKDFLARAPEAEVALARSQHESLLAKIARLRETLLLLR